MCTVITSRMIHHPRTAKKDIVVYKVGDTTTEGNFRSSIQYFVYIPDKVYDTKY